MNIENNNQEDISIDTFLKSLTKWEASFLILDVFRAILSPFLFVFIFYSGSLISLFISIFYYTAFSYIWSYTISQTPISKGYKLKYEIYKVNKTNKTN